MRASWRIGPPLAVTLAAAAGCAPSVQGKDLCASDQQCVPGNVCRGGHCGPAEDAGTQTDDSQPAADGGTPAPGVCAAGVSASADAGGVRSLCAASAAPLCEGFDDDGQLAAGFWEPVTRSAQVSVDPYPCRGSAALKVEEPGEAAEGDVDLQAEVSEDAVVPVDPDFYARVFAYFPSPVPTRVFRIVGLLENGGVYAGAGLWVSGGFLMPALATGANVTDPNPLPTDRWICLELHLRPDKTAGEVQVWIDEQEIPDLHLSNVDTTIPDGAQYGRFSLGVLFPSGGTIPAYAAWFDELALDTTRIHCDR